MNCKTGSLSIIEQIQVVLLSLNEEQYTARLNVLSGSTIGMHFNHIFDMYNAVASKEGNIINYKDIEEDTLISSNPKYACLAFESLRPKVEVLVSKETISVVTDFDIAINDCQDMVLSSVGRELMHAHDHALHHLVIIRMGLQSAFPTVFIPRNMGVLSSTISFTQTQKHG